MTRVEELCKKPGLTDWERSFLAQTSYHDWLEDHLARSPLPKGSSLEAYVKRHLAPAKQAQQTQVAAPTRIESTKKSKTLTKAENAAARDATVVADTEMDDEGFGDVADLSSQEGEEAEEEEDDDSIPLVTVLAKKLAAKPIAASKPPATVSLPPPTVKKLAIPPLKTSTSTTTKIGKDVKAEKTPSTPVSASLPPVASTSQLSNARWDTTTTIARIEDALKTVSRTPDLSMTKLGEILNAFALPRGGELSEWADRSRIPPQGRNAVMDKMRTAIAVNPEFKNHFVGSTLAMQTLETWLEGVVPTSKAKASKPNTGTEAMKTTILPLLRIIDSLPIEMSHLQKYKLAQRVQKLSTSSTIKPVKDITTRLVATWTKLQEQGQLQSKTVEVKKEVKRKSDVKDVPNKKPKTEIVIPRLATATTSDLSPQAATPIESRSAGAASVPGARKISSSIMSKSGSSKGKLETKKKAVTWTDETRLPTPLCTYQEIDARDSLDDGEDSQDTDAHSRDLSLAESSTFRIQRLEEIEEIEEIDYYAPPDVCFPDNTDYDHARAIVESAERDLQDLRESSAMEVVYDDPTMGPPCAGEEIVTEGDAGSPTLNMALSQKFSENPEILAAVNRIHFPAVAIDPELRAILHQQTSASQAQVAEQGGYDPSAPASYAYDERYGVPPAQRASGWGALSVDYQESFSNSGGGGGAGGNRGGTSASRSRALSGGNKGGGGNRGGSTSFTPNSSGQACRFYGTPTGCDWGIKCRHRHGN